MNFFVFSKKYEIFLAKKTVAPKEKLGLVHKNLRVIFTI